MMSWMTIMTWMATGDNTMPYEQLRRMFDGDGDAIIV